MESIGDESMLPDQIDHLLTSNSIPITQSARVSESIVQIDPIDRFSPTADDTVQVSDLQNVKNSKYSTMSITQQSSGCFLVSNPPFGRDFEVVAQKERRLGGYSKELKEIISHRNRKTRENTMHAHIARNSVEQKAMEYTQFICQSDDALRN